MLPTHFISVNGELVPVTVNANVGSFDPVIALQNILNANALSQQNNLPGTYTYIPNIHSLTPGANTSAENVSMNMSNNAQNHYVNQTDLYQQQVPQNTQHIDDEIDSFENKKKILESLFESKYKKSTQEYIGVCTK